MTTVPSATAEPAPAPAPRKAGRESAEPSDGFAAVFAHFARCASMDAAASGRLMLSIGSREPPSRGEGGTGAAHDLPGTGADDAPRGSSLREETARGAGAFTVRAHDKSDGASRGHDIGPGQRPADARPGPAGTSDAARPHPRDRAEPTHARTPARHEGGAPAPGAPAAGIGAPIPMAQPPAHHGGIDAARAIGAVRGAPAAAGASATAGPGLLTGGSERNSAAQNAAASRAPREPLPHHPDAGAFRAQVVQGLSAALRRGQGDVTLTLRPEMLGDLRVRLSVRGREVDATIRPSTIEAHRLLEQTVESLRAALASRGLHVGRIEIENAAQEPRSGAETAQQDAQRQDAGIDSGQERESGGARDAPERAAGGGAARTDGDPQDDGSLDAWALGATEAPGVVYGVADGAARVVMVDALA